MHTVFSSGDGAIVPQQTLELIAAMKHAEIIGISDHLDYITGSVFEISEKDPGKTLHHLGNDKFVQPGDLVE